jgi:serine/threonine protein kinase
MPEPTCTEDPLGVKGKVVGGKYEIGAHLGAGGFGEVYEAVNVNLRDQRLVIKFFKRVLAKDKFDKEARILCKLDHPNISRVVDYLPEDSAIVIHRIDGRDAETVLWESGPLESSLLLTVARTMADAVAYAHSQGIAHRDLKPSNILIDKHGHVYLIDFGIAKEVGGTATKTGRVALTPNFAAPERHAGIQSYNPFLSDIYELGVTLFNLATRSLPYHNPASPSTSEWRTNAGKKLDPAFRRILRKAMDPDPARRYASAEAMARDLAGIRSAYARPVRRIFAGTGIAVIMLALLALAGGRLREHSAPQIAQSIGAPAPQTMAQPDPGPKTSTPPSVAEDAPTVVGDSGPNNSSATAGAVVFPPETKPGMGTGEVAAESRPAQKREPTPSAAEAKAKPHGSSETQPRGRTDVRARAAAPEVHLTLDVTPAAGEARAWVDGGPVPVGSRFAVSPGSHTVHVAHPDYPLFSQSLNAEDGGDLRMACDLAAAFAGREAARVQLALVPPGESQLLQVTLNGRSHNFSRFPALDFSMPSGEWVAAFRVLPLNGAGDPALRVDSCLYFDGSRTPAVVRGDSGRLTLGAGRGRLLVFWSGK